MQTKRNLDARLMTEALSEKIRLVTRILNSAPSNPLPPDTTLLADLTLCCEYTISAGDDKDQELLWQMARAAYSAENYPVLQYLVNSDKLSNKTRLQILKNIPIPATLFVAVKDTFDNINLQHPNMLTIPANNNASTNQPQCYLSILLSALYDNGYSSNFDLVLLALRCKTCNNGNNNLQLTHYATPVIHTLMQNKYQNWLTPDPQPRQPHQEVISNNQRQMLNNIQYQLKDCEYVLSKQRGQIKAALLAISKVLTTDNTNDEENATALDLTFLIPSLIGYLYCTAHGYDDQEVKLIWQQPQQPAITASSSDNDTQQPLAPRLRIKQ